MAATLSGLHHASPSAVFTACRSRQYSQQETFTNVLCSSSQLRRQGASGSSVSKLGFSETKNHVQVPFLERAKQGFQLMATAFAEEAEAVSEDAAGALPLPDTVSATDFGSSPVELSGSDSLTQFDEAEQLRLGITEAAEPSSSIVTDSVSGGSPSGYDVPSSVDGINSGPSTSVPGVDVLKTPIEVGPAGETILSAKERYLRATQGENQGLEQLKFDDFGDSVKAAQDAASNSVQSLVNAFRDTVDSAADSFKDVYDSINGTIVRTIKPFTRTYDKGVDDVQSAVDGARGVVVDRTQGVAVDFTSVFRMGTPANDALRDLVTVVKTAAGSALAATGNVISQAYFFTKDSLPGDIQSVLDTTEKKVSQLLGPLGSGVDQALVIITDVERALGIDPDNPVVPVVLIAGGSLFLGFGYFRSQYAGYSGDLIPIAALDLLKNDRDAVLVDIRPQETRETDGVPDLRRSTRSKFASVEVVKVEGAQRSQLKNASDIEAALTAAIIRNLKNVNRSSKIIVLDADGGDSKKIARRLKRIGVRRAYLVNGGFKAWASSGLRVKSEGLQNPLTILQEDAEAIVEEFKPTPDGVFAVLLGFVAGTYALIEWEKSLQLIGVVGLATTVYSRVEAYESVEDVKADLRLLQKPFIVATEAIVWIAGLVEPKKLQLATSPASSNVQGRVIQAAAKHGPISSELELVQDDSNAGEAVEDEGDGSVESQHTSLQEPQ